MFSFCRFRPISSFLACAFPFRHHVARRPRLGCHALARCGSCLPLAAKRLRPRNTPVVKCLGPRNPTARAFARRQFSTNLGPDLACSVQSSPTQTGIPQPATRNRNGSKQVGVDTHKLNTPGWESFPDNSEPCGKRLPGNDSRPRSLRLTSRGWLCALRAGATQFPDEPDRSAEGKSR